MGEAETLAKTSRGAQVAAAGCGKTHLIAEAISKWGGGRELILTHTHAGVDALRHRLHSFGVPSSAFRIDTIAGWALRYAASFPQLSGLSVMIPKTNDEWTAVYGATARLLRRPPIKEIVRQSYTGLYVDEYQDCMVQQHELVLALAEILPCRLLGDPLQGIFNFGSNTPISWENHVKPSFTRVPASNYPWRWKDANFALGQWLQRVRSDIEAGNEIHIGRDAPVRWIQLSSERARSEQTSACREAAHGPDETVVAICKWGTQGQKIVRRLRGMYSCVEPIDCKDLFKWTYRIANSQGFDRAVDVLDFASECMTGIKTEMRGVRNAFVNGKQSRSKKYREQVEALMVVVTSDSLTPAVSALEALARVPGVPPDRRELLNEMKRAIREHECGEFDTLSEAAWKARNRTRFIGRRLARFCMGTTLLVKGLEFDHAVVLNADEFDRENLYVALTRGKKSLTVLSREPLLRPTVS